MNPRVRLQINFQRAAIGFSYSHWNKCPKINFEMRFHRNFIDNGLVFVEVIQKDSPLTADKAILFLTLLQQESDDQFKLPSQSTVLSRTLQQLPRLIESMKVSGEHGQCEEEAQIPDLHSLDRDRAECSVPSHCEQQSLRLCGRAAQPDGAHGRAVAASDNVDLVHTVPIRRPGACTTDIRCSI